MHIPGDHIGHKEVLELLAVKKDGNVSEFYIANVFDRARSFGSLQSQIEDTNKLLREKGANAQVEELSQNLLKEMSDI